jgi:hypothetical protein
MIKPGDEMLASLSMTDYSTRNYAIYNDYLIYRPYCQTNRECVVALAYKYKRSQNFIIQIIQKYYDNVS